jgi:hypothetical protein
MIRPDQDRKEFEPLFARPASDLPRDAPPQELATAITMLATSINLLAEALDRRSIPHDIWSLGS